MSDAAPPPDIVTELREREADLTQQVALAEARLEEVRALLELLAPTKRRPGRKPGWKREAPSNSEPPSQQEAQEQPMRQQGAIYNPEGAL